MSEKDLMHHYRVHIYLIFQKVWEHLVLTIHWRNSKHSHTHTQLKRPHRHISSYYHTRATEVAQVCQGQREIQYYPFHTLLKWWPTEHWNFLTCPQPENLSHIQLKLSHTHTTKLLPHTLLKHFYTLTLGTLIHTHRTEMFSHTSETFISVNYVTWAYFSMMCERISAVGEKVFHLRTSELFDQSKLE